MKRLSSEAFENSTSEEELKPRNIPDGPKTFTDLFAWPENFLHRLGSTFPHLRDTVFQNLEKKTKVILSTSFSGMGTPEIALKMISSVLQKHNMWNKDNTLVYGACDFDCNSQKLLCHHGQCGAQHVFQDVCGVVPEEVVSQLQQFLKPLQESFASAPSSNQSSARESLEKKFHSFAQNLLSKTVCGHQSWCTKCEKQCQRFWANPSISQSERYDHLTMEIGGSPCIPFVKGGLISSCHFDLCSFCDLT